VQKLLTTAAMLAIATTMAHAEEKTLYVSAYGGSTEKHFKEIIIPKWEERSGANVVYVAGNSTDTLAKLRAQEGAQEIDVAFIDDGPMAQAISFGYCDTVKEETFADLYQAARMPEGKAVGIGIIATGIAYNTEIFTEKGWDAPTSWADLADPKYKGSELFQNREIALSVWGSGRLKALADSGFPGAFAYPKEGGIKLLVAACPVVESDVPDLAQDFLQFVTSPEIQKVFAVKSGWAPVNATVELSEDESRALPVVNAARGDWTKQWTRRIEN